MKLLSNRHWSNTLEESHTLNAGTFSLKPVTHDDIELLYLWMNDPAVAKFWNLARPREHVAEYLEKQLTSAHSAPYFGILNGQPMSYWEIYWADLDPLAKHYQAQAHDGGIHLLLGPANSRGKGLGSVLIAEVARRMFSSDTRISRVVAEPNIANIASIRSFQRAGFTQKAELELPNKRAALLIKENS